MKLQRIKASMVRNESAPVRRELYEGRQHLVAPVVLMVEGVHSGSGGPLFYPASELRKFPEAWNGIPLPIHHPVDAQGHPISANAPQLIERRSVGQLFNVRFDGEGARLIGEVWVDEGKAKQISPETLGSLNRGEEIEVSVGVFTEDDGKPGDWNQEHFTATVRNYRPDHLALLPGGVGACSIADGCGIRALEQDPKDREIAAGYFLIGSGTTSTEVKPFPILNCASNSNCPCLVSTNKARYLELERELVVDEVSHQEIRSNLQRAVDALDNADAIHFVREVFDESFVFAAEPRSMTGQTKFFRANYTVDDKGEVEIAEERTEVRREWVPVPAAASNKGEGDMPTKQIKAMVDALIANDRAVQCTEEVRETLEAMNEEGLKLLEPPEVKSDPDDGIDKPTDNGRPAELTVDEALQLIPNEGLRRSLKIAHDRSETERKELVAKLVADERCELSEGYLQRCSLDVLQKFAKMCHREVDYTGAAGSPDLSIVNEEGVTVYGAPPPEDVWDLDAVPSGTREDAAAVS